MVKRVISLLLSIVMLLPLLSVGVLADGESKDYPADDFKTWTQFDARWGGYKYGSTKTIKQTGCMIASIAVIMAYADPSKRDWRVFNPKILVQNHLKISGNCLADYNILNQDPVTFIYVRATCVPTRKEAAKLIKEDMEKGYYTMVYAIKEGVYSHYSPVVGWNSETNEPILWDVGNGYYGNDKCEPGCCWNSKFYKAEGGHGRLQVITYKSTLTSSLDTVYNGDFDPSKDVPADRKDDITEGGRQMEHEWEIHGMPSKSDMVTDQLALGFGSPEEWDVYAKTNSDSIKQNIYENRLTVVDYIRIAFVFVGIILIVYSLLLLSGYLLDKTNSFIDISFLSILSLGILRIWDESMDEDKKKQGYVTETGLYFRIVIVALVGILFVSGVVSKFAYMVYGLFS